MDDHLKKCSRCRELRSTDDFAKNRRLKDGHSYTCKTCTNQWMKTNKESISIRMSNYRKKNRVYHSRCRLEWKHSNREKFNLMEVRRLQSHYELVNKLKEKACMDCKKSFPSFCMDFDHKPGEVKRKNVSRMLGFYSLKSINAEIEKCELVCKNCHMIRTTKRARRDHDRPYKFGNLNRQEICTLVDEARTRPCSDCNNTYRVEVMQFDHTRGIKVKNLSKLKLTGTLQQVLDEIDKCDIVCANCHAVRTNTRDISKLRQPGYRKSVRAILDRSNQASTGALQQV